MQEQKRRGWWYSNISPPLLAKERGAAKRGGVRWNRVSANRAKSSDFQFYAVNNRIKIFINLVVRESQEPDFHSFDAGLPVSVISFFKPVYYTVNFQCKLYFRAIEIQNKTANAVLSSKFHASKITSADKPPEALFLRSLLFPQFAPSVFHYSSIVDCCRIIALS